jgi:hypothetical protein
VSCANVEVHLSSWEWERPLPSEEPGRRPEPLRERLHRWRRERRTTGRERHRSEPEHSKRQREPEHSRSEPEHSKRQREPEHSRSERGPRTSGPEPRTTEPGRSNDA